MRVRIFAVSLAMSAWATVTGAQTEMPRRCNPFVSSGSDAAVSTRPAAMRPYVMPSREAARSFDPSTLWEPVIPDPIGFQNATLVVDPIRHRLIAIGGEGWDGFPLDVFVHPLDPSGTWERLEISGTLPTGVFGGG